MCEAVKEAARFALFLLSPAILAFAVCLWRGVRAEINERKGGRRT